MSEGFKVWHLLHNDYLNTNPHVAGALVTGGLFIAGGIAYRLTTSAKKTSKVALTTIEEDELVPGEKFGMRNALEALSEYVRDRAREIIGPHYPEYLPLLIFIFMWILVNNLIGLIPGFGSPTDNLNTTLSMGIFVFIFYNIQGFRYNGIKYLDHFTGHLRGVLLLALGWLMFPLELISHSIRPLTLGIRLRTNIYADHSVYDKITELIYDFGHYLGLKLGFFGDILGWVLAAFAPIPLILLGLIVCLIQALVFTLLTSVYISIATAHEDH